MYDIFLLDHPIPGKEDCVMTDEPSYFHFSFILILGRGLFSYKHARNTHDRSTGRRTGPSPMHACVSEAPPTQSSSASETLLEVLENGLLGPGLLEQVGTPVYLELTPCG